MMKNEANPPIPRPETAFRPPRRLTLSEEIAGQVRALLRKGRLGPGDRLPPERELARLLGVSRNSLREALRTLVDQDVLVSRRGDGTYVAAGSQAAFEPPVARAVRRQRRRLADILAFRLAVEPEMAALAAAKAGPGDVQRLRKVLEDQAGRLGQGRDDADLDAQFHRLLAKAGKNGVFVSVMAALDEIVRETRLSPLRGPGRRKDSLRAHRAIVEAVAARDAGAARQAMRGHLEAVASSLLGDADRNT